MATGDNLVKVSQLQTALTRVKTEIDALDDKTFSSVAVSGGKINFYASDDATGTALASIDLPEEIFLDQSQTTFVQNFTFSTLTYPGATNPNLDGKPVFVLAVKGDKSVNPTLTYSFVNLEGMGASYSAGGGIGISNDTINVSLSANAGNILSIANDGLLGEMKVSGAVQGNFAIFGASGAIVDSGFTVAADADITSMINGVFGVIEEEEEDDTADDTGDDT